MNTTRAHEKAKANGKLASKLVDRGEKEALEKGQVILDMAQDTAEELLRDGSRLAKKAGAKAVSFGKSHPVQFALGGLVLGFLLRGRIFGK